MSSLTKDELKDYSDFIQGVELLNIIQLYGKFEFLRKSTNISNLKPILSNEIIEIINDKFSFIHKYKLHFRDKGTRKHVIIFEVSYFVSYSVKKKPGEKQLQIFKESNIPLNTWPFFREFVKSSTSRADYPPLYLPALKTSTS